MFGNFEDFSFLFKILISVICGFVVGVERQTRGKSVGIRTNIIICMGSMLFIHLGLKVVDGKEIARVLGQVVTGIGFLGAGVIMTREGSVKGMTSAAIVWLLAGVGSAIGLGFYDIAIGICFITLLVSIGIEHLEDLFPPLRKGSDKKT